MQNPKVYKDLFIELYRNDQLSENQYFRQPTVKRLIDGIGIDYPKDHRFDYKDIKAEELLKALEFDESKKSEHINFNKKFRQFELYTQEYTIDNGIRSYQGDKRYIPGSFYFLCDVAHIDTLKNDFSSYENTRDFKLNKLKTEAWENGMKFIQTGETAKQIEFKIGGFMFSTAIDIMQNKGLNYAAITNPLDQILEGNGKILPLKRANKVVNEKGEITFPDKEKFPNEYDNGLRESPLKI